MDPRSLLGLGVSLVFAFLRWRFPSVPKPLATFGAVIGVGLLIWSALPNFDWRWAAILIGVAASVAAVLDATLSRKPFVPSAPKGNVDQSVTSYNQSGGITARNVNTTDD